MSGSALCVLCGRWIDNWPASHACTREREREGVETMPEDKSRMKEADRKHVEELLLAEVQAFIETLEEGSPCWDDGEYYSIRIRGARASYTDDDYPLYSFQVKHTREDSL